MNLNNLISRSKKAFRGILKGYSEQTKILLISHGADTKTLRLYSVE